MESSESGHTPECALSMDSGFMCSCVVGEMRSSNPVDEMTLEQLRPLAALVASEFKQARAEIVRLRAALDKWREGFDADHIACIEAADDMRAAFETFIGEVNEAEGDYAIGLAMTKAEKALEAAHETDAELNEWQQPSALGFSYEQVRGMGDDEVIRAGLDSDDRLAHELANRLDLALERAASETDAGQICSGCNGRGEVGGRTCGGDWDTEPCPVCAGTGVPPSKTNEDKS